MQIQVRRRQILVEMAQIDTMGKGRLTEEYRDSYEDGEPVKLGPYDKHQRWEKGKNLSRRFPVATADKEGLPLRDPHSSTYLAFFAPAEAFGLCILKEARLYRLGNAGQAVVIVGGAHWIWNQAAMKKASSPVPGRICWYRYQTPNRSASAQSAIMKLKSRRR